jgi:hypothetical protein
MALRPKFLADKPLFADVADEFLAFVGGAPLVAHNAGFDIAFLNAELQRVAKPPIGRSGWLPPDRFDSRSLDPFLSVAKPVPFFATGRLASLPHPSDRLRGRVGRHTMRISVPLTLKGDHTQ